MTEEEDYQPRNRHKVKEIKHGKFWCGYCDAFYGSNWGKCPVCGGINKDKIKYNRRRSSFNAGDT
jgi:hypothetical protein